MPYHHVTVFVSCAACAQAGLAVKPRVGDALLFYSLTPDGGKDKLSLHAGCPVIKGEKWSATK
jgi:prolyl 4-hydroxylase